MATYVHLLEGDAAAPLDLDAELGVVTKVVEQATVTHGNGLAALDAGLSVGAGETWELAATHGDGNAPS
jgi:hypothetical protein